MGPRLREDKKYGGRGMDSGSGAGMTEGSSRGQTLSGNSR